MACEAELGLFEVHCADTQLVCRMFVRTRLRWHYALASAPGGGVHGDSLNLRSPPHPRRRHCPANAAGATRGAADTARRGMRQRRHRWLRRERAAA